MQKYRPMPQYAESHLIRFHKRTKKGLLPTDCWIFGVNTKSVMGIHGIKYLGNRLSYYFHTGIDPKELDVCHTCDNPMCVNPAHLFLGTAKDNLLDMKLKGRSAHGTKQHRSKLTDTEVLAIRKFYKNKAYSQPQLGKMFGVCQSTIHHIIKYNTWEHLQK